jgi:hypothetical protein
MGILDFLGITKSISEVVDSIGEAIDRNSLSDEEQLELRNDFKELKNKTLELEHEAILVQADIINTESKGESWLQKNWRPLMMMLFMGLILSYWFGFSPPNLTEAIIIKLFSLVELGIGGYIVGRSAEKVVKIWKNK